MRKVVHANFANCELSTIATGLTQWDYGQVLQISGLSAPGGTEVHYALERSNMEAVISIAELKDGDLYSRIPNRLLESGEDLKAYVYIADEDSGETIRKVILPVERRQKPGDYSTSEEKDLLRRLIEELSGKADGIIYDEKERYIQLASKGTPIGERIRYPTGGGREIELKNNGLALQWRYTDSNEWYTLANIDELRGKAPEFEVRNGHLYAIYKE